MGLQACLPGLWRITVSKKAGGPTNDVGTPAHPTAWTYFGPTNRSPGNNEMLELDDETLKEVGRLVIEFNDLDERITALAAAIFECAEWGTAEYLRQRLTGPKLKPCSAFP